MSDLYVSTTFGDDGSKVTEVVAACQKAGITHLELGSNHCHEANLTDHKVFCEGDFLVHNYFPAPEVSFVLNLASGDEGLRLRSLEQAFSAIEFCAAIGARLYTFHPGFLTDPDGPSQSGENYDFLWDDRLLDDSKPERDKAFNRILQSMNVIAHRASALGVKIAVETEGSFRCPGHLLMQRPEEYERFFREFGPEDIGINLNIGHLPLSARVFGFSREEFVDLTASRIVAMELSHNNELDDQHFPLQAEGWYWPLICDRRFIEAYKILEFRDTTLDQVQKVIALFEDRKIEVC